MRSTVFSDSAVLPKDGEEDGQLMRFVLRNVFSELLAAYNARMVELQGNIYGLLCIPQHGEAWQEKLEEILQNGRHILKENFDFHLSVALSSKVQGLHRIRQAYAWARDALALRHPGEDMTLISWRQETVEHPMNKMAGDVELAARHLEQFVAAGDESSALKELRGLQKDCMALPGWSIRMHCAALLHGVMQSLLLRATESEADSVIQRVQQYMESPLVQDDFAELSQIISLACKAGIAGNENSRQAEIVQHADAYIREHYAQSSMSIGQVADFLGMTASYVSTLYKKQMGKSMLDAINLTRIHHAKLLLSGSHMSLEQIAVQVGYYNSSTFIRAFKKYKGITPGQYRASKGQIVQAVQEEN